MWIIICGGKTAKTHKKKALRYIEKYKPIVIGTNKIPKEYNADYHMFVNKKSYAKYGNMAKGKVILGKNLGGSFEYENEYPSYDGLIKIENKIVKGKGATVAAFAAMFAILNGAKELCFIGLDGYKHTQNIKDAMKQSAMFGILKDIAKKVNIKILTPTVYDEWHEDIHNHLNG